MFDFLSSWYRRYFTDPQAALLVVLLVAGFLVIYFMGDMLAPLLAAVVIAYLLEGPLCKLQRRMPRLAAVAVIFLLFIMFLAFVVVGLMPILFRQATQLLHELPGMINRSQELLLRLPQRYPEFITEESVRQVFVAFRGSLTEVGPNILSVSVASIPAIVALLIYLVLVPLMIFFFLKDRNMILTWLSRFLPAERHLLSHLWEELDDQFGNYIRGKVYEIIIVGASAYMVFKVLGLNYAPLLAIAVGLSVLIPYIGAAAVTLPVAAVGWFQWGFGWDFGWLMLAYLVLQFLDGNVLVPLLFSDVVNIHPVAIIAAILVFGGLWGFWGVFFAIPLATLVKALINAWPSNEQAGLSPTRTG